MLESCTRHLSTDNTVAQAVAKGIAEGVSGTHFLSMHFHSNLNPFKSELLQQKFLTSDHNSALSCTKLCTHCQKK
uniref:Uncharacterized protein n=1 Tax=Serinus canaria TaxID=9135 RepID=A0A8C9MFD5_SERCA